MQDYILYCFHSIIPRQQNLTLFLEKKKERERENQTKQQQYIITDKRSNIVHSYVCMPTLINICLLSKIN